MSLSDVAYCAKVADLAADTFRAASIHSPTVAVRSCLMGAGPDPFDGGIESANKHVNIEIPRPDCCRFGVAGPETYRPTLSSLRHAYRIMRGRFTRTAIASLENAFSPISGIVFRKVRAALRIFPLPFPCHFFCSYIFPNVRSHVYTICSSDMLQYLIHWLLWRSQANTMKQERKCPLINL